MRVVTYEIATRKAGPISITLKTDRGLLTYATWRPSWSPEVFYQMKPEHAQLALRMAKRRGRVIGRKIVDF